ncbi:hypothetical protein [Synechococcus sp. UW140]|uniref:hypothetical protein n=1 Tax=Synechococcus sp. UW140 TaxID=368503 RepID=UPI000E0E824D|nr:hypothetical protein [Synechococcus sp. UW140]
MLNLNNAIQPIALAGGCTLAALSLLAPPQALAELGVDLEIKGGDSSGIGIDLHEGDSDSTIDTKKTGRNSDKTQSPTLNDDGYDPCFIHPDCKAGVAYSNDRSNTMGPGWYCKDGKLVNKNTNFDPCKIQKGCTSDIHYVGFLANNEGWICLEKAFIHKGCSKTPGFASNGSLGAGWYCSDNKKVDQSTPFDPAAIKAGCSQQGSGIKFSNGAWICQ